MAQSYFKVERDRGSKISIGNVCRSKEAEKKAEKEAVGCDSDMKRVGISEVGNWVKWELRTRVADSK